MKKLFANSIIFLITILLIGELIVRFTHTMSDLPERIISDNGIQKYKANQTGYWKGGNHKWQINRYGWPGIPPKRLDSLITIVGDSFVENFMNHDSCHQAIKIKSFLPKYNYLEAARSGVSFIEALEIKTELDSLNPKVHLLYAGDSDFYESIKELNEHADITQYSLVQKRLIKGQMKAPGIKKILYNWKLLYYLYNRFLVKNKSKKSNLNMPNEALVDKKNVSDVRKLLKSVVKLYDITNVILIFYPDTSPNIMSLCQEYGFKSIYLDDSNDSNNWTFEHDKHWNCYGNEQAAKQVANGVIQIIDN